MGSCDVCGKPTTREEGTAYTADEFRNIVRLGFEPDHIVTRLGPAAVQGWKTGLVANSTTGWLLCPSCAGRARRYLPKPAGTGAAGRVMTESMTGNQLLGVGQAASPQPSTAVSGLPSKPEVAKHAQPAPAPAAKEILWEKNRQCPNCGQEIQSDANTCRHCKAKFKVEYKGYCATEHIIVETDAKGLCSKCGKEALDKRIESTLLEVPLPPPPKPATAVEKAKPEPSAPEKPPQTKKCPMCSKEIKAEAKICRFCKAKFELSVSGFCKKCQKIVPLNEAGKCTVCGGEAGDQRIESKLIEEKPAPAPKKPASPEAVSEIIRLCDEIDRAYRGDYNRAQETQRRLEIRIREIGQNLFDEGGEALMLRVGQTVAARSKHGRYLDGAWDGIGTWLG